MILEINRETIDNLKEFSLNNLSKKEISLQLDNNNFLRYLILKIDNRLIGYLSYQELYERFEIVDLYIEEDFRNKGYGSNLIKKIIDIVELKKGFNITLEVKMTNKYAIILYKKFGFKEVAIRKGYYDGVDAILMERKMM